MMTPGLPTPEAVEHAASSLKDWQALIIAAISGGFGVLVVIGRSVKQFVRRIETRNDTHLQAIDGRLTELERHRHETDAQIIALQSLAREVDRIGQRVEGVYARLDDGFDHVNETLERITNRCFAFHSAAGE